jgi:hypothetical protein
MFSRAAFATQRASFACVIQNDAHIVLILLERRDGLRRSGST